MSFLRRRNSLHGVKCFRLGLEPGLTSWLISELKNWLTRFEAKNCFNALVPKRSVKLFNQCWPGLSYNGQSEGKWLEVAGVEPQTFQTLAEIANLKTTTAEYCLLSRHCSKLQLSCLKGNGVIYLHTAPVRWVQYQL